MKTERENQKIIFAEFSKFVRIVNVTISLSQEEDGFVHGLNIA
jgi:hypothetical protein